MRKKYKQAENIPEADLPDNFDLRKQGGFDFTAPIKDQKKCGSCYTFGFVSAIESRLMYKYGQKIPQLSA